MSLPKYTAYTDSAVEWIGSVPDHWAVQALKRHTRLLTEKTDRRDHPVALENIEGWTGRFLPTETEFEGDGVAFDPGDILFGKLRPYLAKTLVAMASGEAVGDFLVLRPSAAAVPDFVGYQMRSRDFISIVDGSTFGSKMPRASWDFVGAMPMPLPPSAEQHAIAAFLDRETAKIDALVEEQKRLIELLKEKRQAVISQAVTKGLDPNVPMKESGVEWLGGVPAHWQVRPLKRCIAFQEGPGIMAADFRDEGVPLLRISCVQSEVVTLDGCNYLDPEKVARQWSHFRVETGDLLISGSASMGVVSEVGEEAAGAVPYTGLMRLQGRHGGMLKDFIKHLVVSDSFMRQVQLLKTGSTIQHFGPTHLNQMLVVLPPEDEQEAIAKFLTSENRRMDSLCAEAEAGMALLQERRSALISAAVTGKIDVRGFAKTPTVAVA